MIVVVASRQGVGFRVQNDKTTFDKSSFRMQAPGRCEEQRRKSM